MYRFNDYFSVSGGRFHTAIGYYNTAYHHGNWLSTAEGRPIMYLFEDSGGVLPVHTVGVTMTGLIPQTGRLGLHWVAEMGNGRASNPGAAGAGPKSSGISIATTKPSTWPLTLSLSVAPGAPRLEGPFYHDRLAPGGRRACRTKMNIERICRLFHIRLGVYE